MNSILNGQTTGVHLNPGMEIYLRGLYVAEVYEIV